MKMLLMGLAAAIAPTWLLGSFNDPPATPECAHRVTVLAEAGEPGTVQVFTNPGGSWTSADSAGNQSVVVLRRSGEGEDETADVRVHVGKVHAVTNADGTVQVVELAGDPAANDGRSEHQVVALARVAGPEDAEAMKNRGWLGVSIGQVPDPLAEQLNLQGRGVMVLNVVAGSPADQAGMKAHDVVLAVGHEELAADVSHLPEIISAYKPGDTVNVLVLRQGQEESLNVVLGSRAELGEMQWKFRVPLGDVEERVHTRGRIVQRGPNGEWVMKDLGDVSQLPNLPDNIRMFIPQSGSRETRVSVNNGQTVIETSVERDGTTISLERQDEGPITVTRTDASGQTSTVTYNTPEELAAADAEAHELLANAGANVIVDLDVDGLHGLGDFTFNWNLNDWQGDVHKWHEALEQHLGQAGDAYHKAMEEWHRAMEQWFATGKNELFEQAMEEFRTAMEQWKAEGGAAPLPQLPRMLFLHGDGTGDASQRVHVVRKGRAVQTFELKADGSIEVRIRKGDSEMVETFANETDLSRRDPQLYEKYLDLVQEDDGR